MCGIIASSGTKNVIDDIVLGLKRLEYRGYDSAGIAYNNTKNSLQCKKFKGRVAILEENVKDLKSGLFTNILSAIGHTRWATHGVPSDINAHPHTNGELAIVHNGIIENYSTLKEGLIQKGYTFQSQTDTEVALFTLYDLIKQGLSKLEALQKLLTILQGSFAIVVLFSKDDIIYGIKRGAPMVVGYGKNKNFIASDVYAIAGLAKDVCYIEDNEIVSISSSQVSIYNSAREPIEREKKEIIVQPNDVEKGSYSHYMLKEIYEQSGSIRTNILNHYDLYAKEIFFPHFTEELSRFKFVKIISCGTSYNAGEIARGWLERCCKIEVSNHISSEFTHGFANLNLEDTLYIFISQSGETADTISALKKVQENKIKSSRTLAIINVAESQMARIAEGYIECFCGPEIGVAATKSFTSQLISLALLTLKIALDKSLLSENEIAEIMQNQIQLIPHKIDTFLGDQKLLHSIDELCESVSNDIQKGLKIIYVGRGELYGICKEAALKTQELFYIPILSFTAGELKHGPIAILDDKTLVIVLSNTHLLHNKISSSIEEIAARQAKIVLISNLRHEKANIFIDTSLFGDYNVFATPILYAVPIHLISYKISLFLGNDVDKPRGLAKSVTVE